MRQPSSELGKREALLLKDNEVLPRLIEAVRQRLYQQFCQARDEPQALIEYYKFCALVAVEKEFNVIINGALYDDDQPKQH